MFCQKKLRALLQAKIQGRDSELAFRESVCSFIGIKPTVTVISCSQTEQQKDIKRQGWTDGQTPLGLRVETNRQIIIIKGVFHAKMDI